ncbi:MAG: quercetin 2,3-dioxygenase [Opitutae bacterium]|nr:quercetin 2,3-dioxygenase [Opitutae bacterium]|tara:strand:- start:1017 stop:1730 length:714 start_codon:yes stop_codon:yes gene_type:complete
MNFRIRKAKDRGTAKHGWLHANYTFSFANYQDPNWSGFYSLIVMNNDIIEPRGGFPTHPHKDAEIFTYVISGELEHRDSMGNGSVIKPGDLQYMSAGSGVTHSEFNTSAENQTELYQIWMLPNQLGGSPLYAEKKLTDFENPNHMTLLFSGDGKDGSSSIRQNAQFWLGKATEGKSFNCDPDNSLPHAWIQVVSGSVTVGETILEKADGLAIEYLDQSIELICDKDTTFFFFRLTPF